MAAGIIEADMDEIEQLKHTATTAGRLLAFPLTVPLAAPFVELCTQDFTIMRAKEAALVQEAARCDGLAWYADLALIDMIGRLDKAQLRAVKQDRKHERYAFFFGKKRPYEVKRLSLAAKIALLTTWVDPVKMSPYADVAALGPEFEQLVAAAKVAEDARKASADQVAQFCVLGEGAAFTAKLNAARKAALGQLAEMPHKLIGEGLPNDFAEEFFLPVYPRTAKKGMTEKEIADEISRREEEIAELKQELADIAAAKAAEELEQAKDAEDEAAIAEAQKVADEAVAKAKAMKADSQKRKQARQRRMRRQKK